MGYTERGLVRGDGMRARRTADKTSTSAGNACGSQCYFSYVFLVLVVVIVSCYMIFSYSISFSLLIHHFSYSCSLHIYFSFNIFIVIVTTLPRMLMKIRLTAVTVLMQTVGCQ